MKSEAHLDNERLLLEELAEELKTVPGDGEGVTSYTSKISDNESLIPDYQLEPTPDPDWEKPSYWVKNLLTPNGVFGLLALIAELPIMIINSYFISLSIEYILDKPGELIIETFFMGRKITITDFNLMAVTIILCQVIIAALSFKSVAPYSDNSKASNNGFISAIFKGIAYFTLISLVGFEVCTAYLRGWYIEGRMDEALTNAWATGVVASSEVILGTYLIDLFLIPLLLLVGWAVITPFRGFWRWLKIAYPKRLSRKRPDSQGSVRKTLEALYHNIMESLRKLDEVAYEVIKRLGNRILPPKKR